MDYIYFLCVLFVATITHASDYSSKGKLPENFAFKKCEENDEDCKNKRESFMSQYKSYKLHNRDMIEIRSNVDLEITEVVKDGNVQINVNIGNHKK